MVRHNETNNYYSRLKIILTFQKFQIQNVSDNALHHSVNHHYLDELTTESPIQGAADTENRGILQGLRVALQFVCDQRQDVHNDNQTNCDMDNR
jgi:hypothetical protein